MICFMIINIKTKKTLFISPELQIIRKENGIYFFLFKSNCIDFTI